MTRDEALNKVSLSCVVGERAALVDTLVALGLLKFDEPASAQDRFIEAVMKHGFFKSVGEQILGVIARAGLKIVDK